MKRDKIANIANVFNVSPSYLMGWNGNVTLIQNETKQKKLGVTIHVFDRVTAGTYTEAFIDIIDTEVIPEEMAATGRFFGLQIHGDFMEPRMCEGDVVIVRQQDGADSGDIVIATVNGADATCKRLRKFPPFQSILQIFLLKGNFPMIQLFPKWK